MAAKRLYLFIAHGSREPAAQVGFEALLAGLDKSLVPYPVAGAYLTLNKPSITDAVEAAIHEGIEDFVIVPLFFFEGAHLKTDIPKILADLKLKHGRIDFQVLPAIASIEGFSDWVVKSAADSKKAK